MGAIAPVRPEPGAPLDHTGTSARRQARRAKPASGRAIATVALLPFALFMAVFAIYPLFELVRLSVTQTLVEDGKFVAYWFGLENFKTILIDPMAWESSRVTLLFVIACVVSTVVMGLLSALLVERSVLFMAAARNIIVWPAVIAPVVISLMWLLMLDPTIGAINKVALTFGLPTQQWLNSGVGAFFSIVAVDVWHWTPVVFLFMYTALRGLSAEILEAARVDGANERQVLFRIILPMLFPALAAVTVLRIVMSIKAFDEMYLLTRGGPDLATNLISLHLRTMFIDQLDFGYAGALSIYVVAFVVAIVAVAAGVRRFRGAR
jgi:multiple sugar transport system permease protein